MHADLTRIDPEALRRAIAHQAPHLAHLPLTACPSGGTENHLFRLGTTHAVRLPMRAEGATTLLAEGRWLSFLTPHLPLDAPVVAHIGRPEPRLAVPFLIQTWVDGCDAEQSAPRDMAQAANALGDLTTALRAIPVPPDAPRGGGRGGPLAPQDAQFQVSLQTVRALGLGDADHAGAVWQAGLAAAPWQGRDVWLHADLMPTNLITRDGTLCGVIDFGCLCVGDPAYDLTPLWFVLDPAGRGRFMDRMAPDRAMLARARARVVWQAVMALPYYRDTNPVMMRMAAHGLSQALADQT